MDEIVKAAKKDGVKCKDTIRSFAMAYIYEPACTPDGEYTYMNELPESLPFYIRQYKKGNKNLVYNQDQVKTCVFLGESGQVHEFLVNEGKSYLCSICQSIICRKCVFCSTDMKDICMRCYKDCYGLHDKNMIDLVSMKKE